MGRTSRSQPQWWLDASQGYLRALTRKGRRPNTKRIYATELRDCGGWLERNGIRSLDSLNRHHIEGWQDEISTRLKPRTQQVAATAVRGLLRWAADQDLIAPTLWLTVILPRAPRALPRPIPLRELQVLQTALDLPVPATLVRLRTRALFWVLYSSGARISEALSLNRFSFEEGSADVIQKGGSMHQMLISMKAGSAVEDYLQMRSDRLPALFVSHDLRTSGERLGWKEAQRTWDELCVQLGLRRFTSHQLRHSCATSLLRKGVNPLVIAKHLGHIGLASIQGYAEVELESRRRALEVLDGFIPPLAG